MSIRIYRFGSEELTEMHRQARASNGEYSWSFSGTQYIVDHGSFRTLNTIVGGQRVPLQRDL